MIAINNEFFKPQQPSMRSIAGIYPDYQEQVEIADPRVVKRLVNNLAYLFNIEGGDYLTFILGYGHCTRNEDALRYWVVDQLADISGDPDDVMQTLVSHLKTELMMEVYS